MYSRKYAYRYEILKKEKKKKRDREREIEKLIESQLGLLKKIVISNK
jgi:hypothetical protein